MPNIQNTMNCELQESNKVAVVGHLSNYQPSTHPSSSKYDGYVWNITPSQFQHQQSDMHSRPYIHECNHHQQLLNGPSSSQQEYKPVPSNRFHPYINNVENVNSAHSSLINSAVIPQNVSFSNSTQNSSVVQVETFPIIAENLPTPSLSPNQCNKCDQICRTAIHQSEHCAMEHDLSDNNTSNISRSHNETEAFPSHYIIEGKLYDILDLDSQNIVCSPNVDSQVWNHRNTFFLSNQQDLKHVLFLTNQPNNLNQPCSTSVIEPEYSKHQPQMCYQQQPDVNSFNSDANQVLPSLSGFPQGEQFRVSFNSAQSLLPTSASKGKSTKTSNKALRAKTFNCAACDKWFISDTNLQRHYNTNFHKNVVEASAQEVQATVPISRPVPSCEQNKNNIHQGSNWQGLSAPPSPQQLQSPEYSSQHLPPFNDLFNSTQIYPHTQEFQHCANGQANHYVPVSQPEGMLNLIYNTDTYQVLPQQNQTRLQSTAEPHIMNSQDQYNLADFITINTNTPSHQDIKTKILYPDCINNTAEMLSVNDQINISVPNCPIEGATAYQGDSTSFYSQGMSETMFQQISTSSSSVASISPPSSSSIITSIINKTKMESMCACTLCNKVFSKVCYLNQHNKTFHSGAKFRCEKCGKRFVSKIRRDQHLAKHDGVKPYNCEYNKNNNACDKSFNHKADLQRHMAVHTGELPHVCGNCKKGFVRRDHMLKHMNTRRCILKAKNMSNK